MIYNNRQKNTRKHPKIFATEKKKTPQKYQSCFCETGLEIKSMYICKSIDNEACMLDTNINGVKVCFRLTSS